MKKVFIAWSFNCGAVAWTVPETVSLEDVKNIISSNEEELALVSAEVETVDCDTVMALRRKDVKFVLTPIQDAYLTGVDEGYYRASAVCGDFEYELEWDILPTIDTTKEYDETDCCDWNSPRSIYGSPSLSLEDIEIEWN